jgi:solute carrier family 13 (sodium-dependent dicarboxylate transporter), member 2/3/5
MKPLPPHAKHTFLVLDIALLALGALTRCNQWLSSMQPKLRQLYAAGHGLWCRGSISAKKTMTSPRFIRWLIAAALLGLAGAGLSWGLQSTAPAARWALLVFAAAVIAWTVLDLDETPVALAGAVALTVAGATSVERFYASLGDDFIWLLIGAFVLAAVLQVSGLAQRWALKAVAGARTPAALMRRLTWFIIGTAFVVPSTSGRAALLLPVFFALLQVLPQPRLARALALLFPSVILMSACVSMLGAGAHLVALDYMHRLGGEVPGFLGWLRLAGPFGVACSLLACELILRLFLDRDERSQAIALPRPSSVPLTRQQKSVVSITVVVLLAWATSQWHGVPAPMVAVCGALLATVKALTGADLKTTLKKVEWNLVIFMATTMIMGEALVDSGAANALARGLVSVLPLASLSPLAGLAIASLLALLAHLVVTSRTARATVLIPAVALPFASAGYNPALLVFMLGVGSGFCQTLMVSAKPVAMFAGEDREHFGPRDLAHLSLALLPGVWILLLVFAALVWPRLGLG